MSVIIPRPVPPEGTALGCPNTYSVAINYRGGTQQFIAPADIQDLIVNLSWERRLNETSSAKVTLTRVSARNDCCVDLGDITPMVHEITIYRDDQSVWVGPITTVTQTPAAFVIEAKDVSCWLSRLVNTMPVPYNIGPAPWDIVDVAESVIEANLLHSPYSCIENGVDYPNMLWDLRAYSCGVTWNSAARNSWYVYVMDIVHNLAEKGFEWTVAQRSMIMRRGATIYPDPYDYWTWSQATLQTDDLGGDVTVTRSWSSGMTRAFASSQTNQYSGRMVTVGVNCSPYGRLDTLKSLNIPTEEENTPDETKELTNTAVAMWQGAYPLPVSFKVNDNAKLSYDAPITVERLIPGHRIDVMFDDYCQPVIQGMRLILVSATWDQSGEKIGVSLVPLLTPVSAT